MGEDGEDITVTSFLSGNTLEVFQYYVPNVSAALINNYECYLDPTADGNADLGALGVLGDFNSHPPCFFNLGVYQIEPAA